MRIGRNKNGDGAEIINMSSLLDVMFILIIFFLATTTFQQEERDIRVNLPQTNEGQAISAATKLIVINVRRDGVYLVGSEETTIDKMGELMAEAVKANPEQKVLVRGDREALHGHVAAAVATCKKAGINEANIGYQLPN